MLVASVRHKGRSLADIARTEIGPFAGLVSMIAVLFILLVTLAGLGIVVVNALAGSPWGVFTIGSTIPIALVMGLWMFRSHGEKISITGPSVFGVVLLLAAVAGRALVCAERLGSHPHLLSSSDHFAHSDLWIRRVGAAGVAAFGAARLPVHVRQTRHHRRADHRHPDRPPRYPAFRPSPSSSTAAGPSSKGNSSRSSSSRSPAAPSPGSTRWFLPGRRRR